MTASNESALRHVLASVADRMVADFKASGVAKHRGSKGTVREAQLLSNYLGKYLPRTVHAEHSGEVVAVNGQVSQQCDILIVDHSTPLFWDEEDYRIIPAECVCGVIEVKSSLDSEELEKAWKLYAKVTQDPLTSQRLKEDKDRPKYNSKAAEYGTDGVRGRLGVGNQVVERKAHDQEDDEPLDPRHVGLLILAVTPGYSNTLPHVQVVLFVAISLIRMRRAEFS